MHSYTYVLYYRLLKLITDVATVACGNVRYNKLILCVIIEAVIIIWASNAPQ